MDNLGGFKVCGKRGGSAFIDAVRPNKYLECPESFVLCDVYGQDSNTATCVKEGDLASCPITDITLDIESERIASVKHTYQIRAIGTNPPVYFSKHGG